MPYRVLFCASPVPSVVRGSCVVKFFPGTGTDLALLALAPDKRAPLSLRTVRRVHGRVSTSARRCTRLAECLAVKWETRLDGLGVCTRRHSAFFVSLNLFGEGRLRISWSPAAAKFFATHAPLWRQQPPTPTRPSDFFSFNKNSSFFVLFRRWRVVGGWA